LLPALRERRNQLAGSLSGGEQQMCAIGRGLMARPDVLLIDEMSLGLAPIVVDGLVGAIDAIHRDGSLSFLLVEQDVQIALERGGPWLRYRERPYRRQRAGCRIARPLGGACRLSWRIAHLDIETALYWCS
jgi:ABC-type ATPase involved in cell division